MKFKVGDKVTSWSAIDQQVKYGVVTDVYTKDDFLNYYIIDWKGIGKRAGFTSVDLEPMPLKEEQFNSINPLDRIENELEEDLKDE